MDPQKMMNDGYGDIGKMMGFIIARFVEKTWIRFKSLRKGGGWYPDLSDRPDPGGIDERPLQTCPGFRIRIPLGKIVFLHNLCILLHCVFPDDPETDRQALGKRKDIGLKE